MHETCKSILTVFPHYAITTSYWQVSAMTHLASNWLNAGVVSRRWGTAHPSIVPYQVLMAKIFANLVKIFVKLYF